MGLAGTCRAGRVGRVGVACIKRLSLSAAFLEPEWLEDDLLVVEGGEGVEEVASFCPLPLPLPAVVSDARVICLAALCA